MYIVLSKIFTKSNKIGKYLVFNFNTVYYCLLNIVLTDR